MTDEKLSFKSIADKYGVFEEDIERIFACYDTNDMEGMRSAIGYVFFCRKKCRGYVELMFDLIQYIKQCEIENTKKRRK